MRIDVLLCLAALFATSNKMAAQEANAGLKLPNGFKAMEVVANLGGVRHIAVTQQGNIYAKLASAKSGKGIIYLKIDPATGKGVPEASFGNYAGTGMYIKNGYLYASSNTTVYRYKLDASGKVANPATPETIISGLLDRGEHNSKSVVLDNDGHIYVNIGAYSNSCQIIDRAKGSMGISPCPILDSAGGIWQFDAAKPSQTYGSGVHYAMGLRNVVGLDWNMETNSLFVMQHGRDQLHDIFPDMYDTKQSAELPAECMYELHKGVDAGWPYIYYDQQQHKKILAPEYGGDGKKEGGEKAIDPTYAFPGHMAPNALLFYTGTQFPEKYRHGAFIAFHGSWNRAPEPQEGCFVAFLPFKNGKPSGDWEIFANNFAGGTAYLSPGKAKHRPCGLAMSPDGSLYVSDDVSGTIYKISYQK